MLVLEYKVKGKQRQYQAIDEAIKTTQFVRNKALRYWIDEGGLAGEDPNANTPPSRDRCVDRFALIKPATIDRAF